MKALKLLNDKWTFYVVKNILNTIQSSNQLNVIIALKMAIWVDFFLFFFFSFDFDF